MKRRTFVKSSLASVPLVLNPFEKVSNQPALTTPLNILIFNTNWGFQGSLDEYCKKTKEAGYDGIEIWWSLDQEKTASLLKTLQHYELEVGFLVGGHESDPEKHFQTFQKALAAACGFSQRPVYINCHSGKDYFSFEDNARLIEFTLEQASKTGIEILHETHRGRMCFAAHITKGFLDQYPEMRLTLDISHWVNVHESMLKDLPEMVDLSLQRVGHIHARIGHPEGPQVNDPRAPEWEKVVDQHLQWWDTAIRYREQQGGTQMTFLTEFGPPNYLPTLPYTNQPVADQWAMNIAMMELIRKRYT